MKTIYGSINCPKCHQLKKELEDKGIEFKYIDVNDMEDKDLRRLGRKYGMSLPIIDKG